MIQVLPIHYMTTIEEKKCQEKLLSIPVSKHNCIHI